MCLAQGPQRSDAGEAYLISFWADVWIFLYRSQSFSCLVDFAFLWAICLRVARRILVFIHGCVCLDEDILDGTRFSMVVIFAVLKFCHMSSTEENLSALNNLL